METNDILGIVFKKHDSFSHDAVFSGDSSDRERAFVKAEAIRDLMVDIKSGFKNDSERKAFSEATMAHVNSLGRGIFYKRQLNFNGSDGNAVPVDVGTAKEGR